MGGVQGKGGIPRTVRLAAATTAAKYTFPFISTWVKLRNLGADPVRVFWLEVDAAAAANYVTVPVAAAITPSGEWEGPVEASALWFAAAASTSTLEVTITQRRG
jgi:hypothetical protein